MSLACSLDTNCLLALLLEERKHQRRAVEDLLVRSECHIGDLAISELEFVLRKVGQYPRGQVVDNIQALLNIESVNCNRMLLRKVLPLYEKHPKLSFNDICLAVQANLNDAVPLYTFDKKLAIQIPEARLVTQ